MHKTMMSTASHLLDGSPQEQAATSMYGSQARVVRMICYLVHLVFRIFDVSNWNVERQKMCSHPMAPLRSFLLLPTIFQIFAVDPYFGYDPTQFARESGTYLVDAESSYALVHNTRPNIAALSSVLQSPDRSTYVSEFKRTWKAIRPALDRFKRGGKLVDQGSKWPNRGATVGRQNRVFREIQISVGDVGVAAEDSIEAAEWTVFPLAREVAGRVEDLDALRLLRSAAYTWPLASRVTPQQRALWLSQRGGSEADAGMTAPRVHAV